MAHPYSGIAAKGVKAKASTRSFAECRQFLGRNYEKIVASNVRVHAVHPEGDLDQCPDFVQIILYHTAILRYYPDGTWEADNGGYNTPTTSSRLNQFGPEHVWFCHGNKLLLANGHPCGRGRRFRVQPTLPFRVVPVVVELVPISFAVPQPEPLPILGGNIVLNSEGGFTSSGEPVKVRNLDRKLANRLGRLLGGEFDE